MSWSPDIGREIRSNGGFSIPHPAVVDTELPVKQSEVHRLVSE